MCMITFWTFCKLHHKKRRKALNGFSPFYDEATFQDNYDSMAYYREQESSSFFITISSFALSMQLDKGINCSKENS